MTKLRVISGIFLMGSIFVPISHAATIGLFDWGFNYDGNISNGLNGDPFPAEADISGFDTNTGLGTITFTANGSGNHFLVAFFDHEIDEQINTFFNEFGLSTGTASAGQSWEIDEPGYLFGDIFTNFENNTLDNGNVLPSSSPDDVSMAIGWEFSLNSNEIGIISYSITEVAPSVGFYLTHTDPDTSPETSIFFTSTLTITNAPVPEPSTMLLFGTGLVGLAGLSRRKKK